MNKFKQVSAGLLAAAVLAVSLSACGESANVQVPETTTAAQTTAAAAAETEAAEAGAASEAPEMVIKVATTGLATQPPSMASHDFFDYVKEASNGKYDFELYDSSTLGSDSDILQQVIDGTLQISGVGVTTFSMYTDKLEVLSLPFLLNNYEKEYKALSSDEYRAICDAVGEQLGIKILFTSENGIRHFATVNKPVHSMSDLKGLKLRIPASNVLEKSLQAIGANPVSVAYSELYSSLQNNVIDGEEVNYSTLSGQKHYEVAKYVTEVGLYCFAGAIIANLDFWNSLPEEDRKIMEEGSALALKNTFEKYVVELDEKCKKDCEDHGMEITVLSDEELQEFRDATAPIIEEYRAKDPLIADFIEMAEAL